MFVLLGAAVIAILWPRDDWEYAVRPELLIANYIEHPEPLNIAEIHRDLALHMDNAISVTEANCSVSYGSSVLRRFS